jgi:ZIP family zinc transporter
MLAITVSLFTFVSTLLGGLFGLKNRKRLHYIMSFTAGVLIAVAFFDILPEVYSLSGKTNTSFSQISIAIVIGYLVFHIIEKTIAIHVGHESEYADHKHPDIGLAGAVGLSLHSFLDGVGIGLGFHINQQVGFLVAFAVIAHDFSDGLNTVTLMLSNHNTNKKTLLLLLLDAIAPVLGAASTLFFTIEDKFLLYYLGFFAGFLLYLGASDLLPEAHNKHSSYRMIGLTVLGIVFIFFVTRFT